MFSYVPGRVALTSAVARGIRVNPLTGALFATNLIPSPAVAGRLTLHCAGSDKALMRGLTQKPCIDQLTTTIGDEVHQKPQRITGLASIIVGRLRSRTNLKKVALNRLLYHKTFTLCGK
ncbi:hypothetical protein EVAR_50519_1 [Eumeta japonica]|uniref:Uncharacterized protein n=1 Tax=Eumeta variegata TaxID=151549 RepID=A0A4C1X7K1_EUMVA|nr:hypothetical protein EVAR_50519_1 [Eumeta japonica]